MKLDLFQVSSTHIFLSAWSTFDDCTAYYCGASALLMLISAAFDQTYVCTGKTTQNATWPAFCVVIAIIHEFNLLSVFMVVLFGTNVKRRNLIWCTKFIIIWSVCPWTKQQMKALSYFPWRSVGIKLILNIQRASAQCIGILKKRACFHFGLRKRFLYISNSFKTFYATHIFFFATHIFFFFFSPVSINSWMVAYFKVTSRLFLHCFFL